MLYDCVFTGLSVGGCVTEITGNVLVIHQECHYKFFGNVGECMG